jgi:protocatechuate 3,4-dioxygenase beta subunit
MPGISRSVDFSAWCCKSRAFLLHSISSIALLLFLFRFDAPCQETPPCDWCGANEAPARISWEDTITTVREEHGDPLVIAGQVFRADGVTPASDIILYFYHTNARGIYPKRGDEKGNGRRHGYLRGWIKTGSGGRYRIVTIRPGSYPSATEPAHIHMTVLEPGREEYSIDEFVFDDDPLVTDSVKSKLRNRGGSGLMNVSRNHDGVWEGKRNITLMP